MQRSLKERLPMDLAGNEAPWIVVGDKNGNSPKLRPARLSQCLGD